MFVGNRAGRRFRPVSRHEPAMNTLNQILPECNHPIASQACQDVCHSDMIILWCVHCEAIWRVSERSYIYFSNLLIYMNSLAASAFEIQVFVVLFPCEVAARLFIRAWFITPMQRGQIREARFRLFSSAPLRRHASIIPQLASDNRLRCVWRILTGAIRCFRWECLRSSSASDRSVRPRDSDSTPAL